MDGILRDFQTLPPGAGVGRMDKTQNPDVLYQAVAKAAHASEEPPKTGSAQRPGNKRGNKQ